RSDALVGTVDIFATVLDMAGIDADHQLASTETDSISFRDVLVGGEGGSQVVLSEIFGSDTSANREGKAIRNDRYKVIDFSNGQIEFFDLIADPRGELPIDEQTRSEAENQVFDELLTTLRTWTADSSAPRPG
ncbi:MAG: hypothetical protein GY926_12410, partial [bacterium]|nr:hypothetical protein [bacterium]